MHLYYAIGSCQSQSRSLTRLLRSIKRLKYFFFLLLINTLTVVPHLKDQAFIIILKAYLYLTTAIHCINRIFHQVGYKLYHLLGINHSRGITCIILCNHFNTPGNNKRINTLPYQFIHIGIIVVNLCLTGKIQQSGYNILTPACLLGYQVEVIAQRIIIATFIQQYITVHNNHPQRVIKLMGYACR